MSATPGQVSSSVVCGQGVDPPALDDPVLGEEVAYIGEEVLVGERSRDEAGDRGLVLVVWMHPGGMHLGLPGGLLHVQAKRPASIGQAPTSVWYRRYSSLRSGQPRRL